MEGFKESDRWKSLELSATLTLSSIGDSSEALVHIFFHFIGLPLHLIITKKRNNLTFV